MKKVLKAVLLLMFFAVDFAVASELPNLDRTDKVHSRRYLDSLNAFARRPIRINQSGFRPQDYKYAYVADPKATKFQVIDANSGAEAWSGSLSLIKQNVVKPNIWINGAFNSISSVYEFGSQDSVSTAKETLYRADFTGLAPSTPGEYFVVVGNDTSATFHIHPSIFNSILEMSLQFFGIQRCGNTKSHFHGACHLKDGSKIGHDLTGGWHDCGDHFKVSETLGYATYVLSMVYLTYQDKAEDRYGNSYADTVFTDGIPDVLYEAKIGADYLLKLYRASKADGLIAQGDMYHSVGVDEVDHAFWDLPERQDAQAPSKGGPDRVVLTDIGTNTAGMFAAAMANVAVGYKVYDAAYSDSLLEAAKDIYENVVMKQVDEYITAGSPGRNTAFPGFYTGGGPLYDDGAAASLALWYATKDTVYQYNLYKNKNIFDNETNYHYNLDYFRAGFLGNTSGFTPGGWATDYQNIHSYVLFAFQKMILSNPTVAAEYGLSETERDSLSMRTMATFRKLIDNSTNDGDSLVLENPGVGSGDPHEGPSKLHVITPYNLVWTSFDWGVMRYNMGTAVSIFLMYELTGDERYLKVALDNMYFILGANPWDISFLMGAGEKNPQHPHNRASNPDGYNAGSMPYKYKCPIGALMGAREPTKTLIEDWNKYTSTETCIDFTAQFLFPAQSLAQTLPIDAEGPLFSNIQGTPITETSAIVSWDANEVALVTVFYNTTPDLAGAKSVGQTKATKGGEVTLEGLEMGQTYYFFLEGMDTKRNMTTDDNHGQWYQFTMTNVKPNISGVTICQVDHRSAKIYWWTDVRSNGVVKYGTSMSALNESATAKDGAVLFHEVELTDLKAGTTYYFSVSSGMSSDDNGGAGYSFTTESEASYADLAIFVKPSSYGDEAACSNWEDCHAFIVSIANNDTMPFEDFEVRMYLNDPNLAALGNCHQNFGGDGQMGKAINITFGSAQSDGLGGYYLPINVKGVLEVSGQLIIQVVFHDYNPSVKTVKYKDIEGSWSLRAHTAEDDPVYFEGIDLTQAPYFKGSETTFLEYNSNNEKVVAFTEDPYIAVFYHGKHIFGYTPDYTPENGPQVRRTVTLEFEKPFKTPFYSVEKEDYKTSYEGYSKVSPTGFLDDLEMNGKPQSFIYDNGTRTDSYVFAKDTNLAYGNNYMEWVSWHNHGANNKTENKYDCACAVVRSNVEIDTITTPLEKRYLSFDKNSYKTYQTSAGGTPKMVEVRVQLLDSLAQLLDTVNVTLTLGTTSGNVLFWSSATSTIPITSIQLVNGEATFYVSSEQVMVTTLFAKVGNSTQFDYEPAMADLIIEELPPWPIIDVAKMVDTDCDNKPDAIKITISNEYQENQSFNSVQFVYNGDTLKTTDVISQNGKEIVVKANIKDTAINTNPSGSITLYSNVGGKVESHTDFYQDGIAPTLLAVSVLERLDTATSDRVYMQFSEPISSPGTDWPTQLFATNGSTAVNAPTVKFTQIYNESMNVWEFVIGFDASGNSIVTEGMFAQLLSNASIKDKSGNEVSATCGQPKLPITLKLIPVPMTYASISDADEDGVAERVYIEYARAIDQKHYPDSISVIFGRTAPETLWVAGTVPTYAADGMTSVLDLPKPFTYGITSGTYEGASKGVNITGAGLVAQHLGKGASYETNSVLGEDLAGPVIVTATIDMSKSDKFDMLDMVLSEPVAVVDSSLVYYREKIADVDTAIYKRSVQTLTIAATKTSMAAIYDKDSRLAVTDGDFVRLHPKEFSALRDAHGNMPATNSPWIPILSSGNPQVKFVVTMQDVVSRSGGELRSQVPSQDNMRMYVLNPATHKLDLIQNGQVVAAGIDSASVQGAVWKIEMTVPRGSSGNEEPAWDSLRVKYNMPIYTNLGSYVNRLAGRYSVPSGVYLSSSGKIVFYVEWANTAVGLQSEQGRAVATGAYIYKLDMETQFVPNENSTNAEKFSGKNSYDKTSTFGIKRVK
ncbi:glycoside hydrolase family 9 protein [Fibrobacter sp. UWOV1]|uniref:glycoside hydrolase family 9 protein n=1 Tax=Fibrobacter sp. UWOV1 TaxID=1896215 RepID=UPI000933D514|nr:glycoside hydrolase family 9 protein [Fibrobacter sp. UWOV1]